jgi:hypothetical protein
MGSLWGKLIFFLTGSVGAVAVVVKVAPVVSVVALLLVGSALAPIAAVVGPPHVARMLFLGGLVGSLIQNGFTELEKCGSH